MDPSANEALDLLLSIRHEQNALYNVDLILRLPGGIEDRELARARPLTLDQVALASLWPDVTAYGAALSAQLFDDKPLDRAWATARSLAQADALPLRVRLELDPRSDALHAIIWESLHDPQTHRPLATSERVLFTRYIGTADLSPIPSGATRTPQALIVVANPTGLEQYQPALAPVDVAGEVARLQTALGPVPSTILAEGHTGRASLNQIRNALRNGTTILAIICHGTMLNDEAYLWLEDDQGNLDRVAGTTLITALDELAERPALIILGACRSGGDGQRVLSALAPRLVQTGIPAVIGAQGDVPMRSVASALPVLISELRRDGHVDRALAAARATLRNVDEWWRFALWCHRPDGQIWRTDAPTPTRFNRLQSSSEAAITCAHLRVSFIWAETFDKLPRSRAAEPLLDLRNAEATADAFDALPVPNGVLTADGTQITRPWPKLHGQHFWFAYLERRPLGAIHGSDAVKQLVPLRVSLPWPITLNGVEGAAALEGFVYPHGVACMITVRCTAQMPLAELTALAPMLRRATLFTLEEATFNLDELAEQTLAHLSKLRTGKATTRGRGGALEPFSIATIVRGTGAAASLPPTEGGPVHTLLETLTRWHVPANDSRLTPLDQTRIPTGTADAQAGDLLYGHTRSRAVWFPRRFAYPQPSAALGCYHRNLSFSALQIESLGALIKLAAQQLADTGKLSGVQRGWAQRAYGILSRMHSGSKDTAYRTMSSHRQISANDLLPALNDVRRAFGRLPLPTEAD